MEHFKGDKVSAFEWTKRQAADADVVVVLLGLRAGSMPFGKPTLLAPYSFFGTEIVVALGGDKPILSYYVGRSRRWLDWSLLFSNNEDERIDALSESATGEQFDSLLVGRFAAQLTSRWPREPGSVAQLLLWVTKDLTEGSWLVLFR